MKTPLHTEFQNIDEAGTGHQAWRLSWTEIGEQELSDWILRLANEEHASIRQYPLFNERFRKLLIKPIYVKCVNTSGDIHGFACLLSFGRTPFKCGVMIDGPVLFRDDDNSKLAAEGLVGWLRSNGFAFVRISTNHQPVIASLSRLPEAIFRNPFPFIPRYGGNLVVPLKASDSDMLASFQQVCRYEIKGARKALCVVAKSSDFEEFQKLWPMFASRAKEKGFQMGSLKDYESLFKLSPREDLVRVYTALYNAKVTYSAVLLREHSTVHYFHGSLDLEALGAHPSPSCLLHWEAMRDYRSLGCSWYNLGRAAGSVYTFKRKFRPSELPSPTTITLVLRPLVYRVWARLVLLMLGGVARSAALLRARPETKK
jgi:hypothetical protein